MELINEEVNLTTFSSLNKSDYDKDGIRDIDEIDLDSRNGLVKVDENEQVTFATLYDVLLMKVR